MILYNDCTEMNILFVNQDYIRSEIKEIFVNIVMCLQIYYNIS